MGTRADFYVGRGKNAEWLGSIAWDGYPDGILKNILHAHNETYYRQVVKEFITEEKGNGSRFPEDGWPWPWEDSRATNYAYAFENNKVHASCFGSDWFDPLNKPFEGEESEEIVLPNIATFPNMKNKMRVTDGGFFIITARP